MFKAFLGLAVAPVTPVVKAVLVKNTYVYDASHVDVSSITAHQIATPVSLAGLSISGSTLDASDLSPGFTDATVGESVSAVILFVEDGLDSYLLLYIDDADITVFPMLVGANRVDVVWNVAGIARL